MEWRQPFFLFTFFFFTSYALNPKQSFGFCVDISFHARARTFALNILSIFLLIALHFVGIEIDPKYTLSNQLSNFVVESAGKLN
jgi:hypothetical protein